MPGTLTHEVRITVDGDTDTITIEDDGDGMTEREVNERYLNVGYRKRDDEQDKKLRKKKGARQPMGRKGIGKLSLFSIADVIELFTMKDGEKSALRIDRAEIEKQIKKSAKADGAVRPYKPEALDSSTFDLKQGTRVVVKQLKKGLSRTEEYLKVRISRRFAIIGADFKFKVFVNGHEVTLADRDYFHKLNEIWWYGEDTKNRFYDACAQVDDDRQSVRSGIIEGSSLKAPPRVTGWIGTASSSSLLKDGKDSINKISVLVRGKVAQEDILETLGKGDVSTRFMIGEIYADFLDADEMADIATSSRQNIIETDPRYLALMSFIDTEVSQLSTAWNRRREADAKDEAKKIPAIDKWFGTLGPDDRERATKLFGTINRLDLADSRQKEELFKHGVIAFERYKQVNRLGQLQTAASSTDLAGFWELVAEIDDIEAASYHRMVRERLQVIDELKKAVDENQLEKQVQNHLFEHLWLLDPSWERAAGSPEREKTVLEAFKKQNAKLADDDKMKRLDIAYRATAGRHVIIELKRPDRKVSYSEIQEQCGAYERITLDVLRQMNLPQVVEVVCVLGRYPDGWGDDERQKKERDALKSFSTRVMFYQELYDSAYAAYKEYLEDRKERGRLEKLLDDISASVVSSTSS